MRGNIKSFEKPFTRAEVVALAERTLKRFGDDRSKAGRYARSMEDRHESAKWAQVVEVIATSGQHHATEKSSSQSQRWLVISQVPGSQWAYVAMTSGGSTMSPDDAFDFGSRDAAESYAAEMQGPRSSIRAKVISRLKKSPAQLQHDIDEVLAKPMTSSREPSPPPPGALGIAVTKASAKAAQSNQRQSIWLTEEGEFRVRPMFEKVSPLWTLVRHLSPEDER